MAKTRRRMSSGSLWDASGLSDQLLISEASKETVNASALHGCGQIPVTHQYCRTVVVNDTLSCATQSEDRTEDDESDHQIAKSRQSDCDGGGADIRPMPMFPTLPVGHVEEPRGERRSVRARAADGLGLGV